MADLGLDCNSSHYKDHLANCIKEYEEFVKYSLPSMSPLTDNKGQDLLGVRGIVLLVLVIVFFGMLLYCWRMWKLANRRAIEARRENIDLINA